MRIRFAFAIATVALIGGLLASAVGAQAPAGSVASGVFTADQAARGAKIYADNCAGCHLEDLSGGSSPPLKGADFLGGWKDKSAATFVDNLKQTMPFDAPGKLSAQEYVDLTAHILSSNEFPAGATELPTDTTALGAIKFEAAKP